MKKKWCKHIKFDKDWNCWFMITPLGTAIAIPKSWKLCPVCATQRPKRAKAYTPTI